jgi:hypothetical protein
MCLADLNRSTLSCNHRWYHLLRPCVPDATLPTCPSKLALEGWVSPHQRKPQHASLILINGQEIKCDFCPFCAGWSLTSGEFLIIGDPHSRHDSISSAASASSRSSDGHAHGYSADMGQRYSQPPSNSVPLSRRPSLATSVSAARRESLKRAQTDASALTYDSGPVHVAGERNQRMTARIDKYLTEYPEHLVERSKSAPTVGSAVWGALNLGASESQDSQSTIVPPVEEEETEEEEEEEEEEPVKQSKPWKKKSKHLTNFARRRSKDLTSLFR